MDGVDGFLREKYEVSEVGACTAHIAILCSTSESPLLQLISIIRVEEMFKILTTFDDKDLASAHFHCQSSLRNHIH